MLIASLIDGADRVNHVPARQTIAARDFRLTNLAAVKRPAFRQQLRTCRTVDAAIHTAAAKQRRIRRVDNGVNRQLCDVTSYNLQRNSWSLPSARHRPESH